MKFNRSEVMKEAWKIYRSGPRNLHGVLQGTFSTALKIAWTRAKQEAAMTKDSVQEALFILRMKCGWDARDFEKARKLEQKLRELAA